MKKFIIPVNKDGLPPLMTVKDAQPTKSSLLVPNAITPILLKPDVQGESVLGNPPKASNMRLVQTADGKKILLTNVLTTSKATANGQVLLLSNSLSPTATNLVQSQPSPLVSTTKSSTVFIKPSASSNLAGEKPVLMQFPRLGHPLVLAQNNQAAINASTLSVKVKANVHDKDISVPAVIPVPLLDNPVLSTSNSGLYINNGLSRFKVIGKPVPVTLGKSPIKIAPKRMKTFVSREKSPSQHPESPSKNLNTVIQGSPLKLKESATSPAYLNIKVKKEEASDSEMKVKLEQDGPMSILDVRIKEEPSDDQSTLLANDEQLRDVLNVATSDMKVNPKPRFYIRTTDGKLVSISPDEAQAMGLNHKDNAKDNRKRLVAALQDYEMLKGQIKTSTVVEKPQRVLIPDDVNVLDFVSRNVPEEAKKAAAFMKIIGKRSSTDSQKEKDNPVIIGEFTENNRRFLKIRIEPDEFECDTCDISITPFNTYQCPFCTKYFKTKDHVISHIRIHTGERPYPCDVCGKRYRQRIDIIRHMRIHTGEKPFTCGLCHASFNQKSNLRSHMRIHTGERPVQCKVCGKGFSRNTHLKQHLKLHTGEKPYKCKVCDRPFRFKSGLQAHERIHSGLKPYACSLCGRSFTQIVGLIRHERTHPGEKPFRCQSCGKSFDNREVLQAHCKKHTDVRPHSCKKCDSTFTDQAALRCHVKKYHGSFLICVICHRQDFKTRIDLREHLREHERDNWQETADGDLVPSLRPKGSHFVSVDDIAENDEGGLIGSGQENGEIDKSESEFDNTFSDVHPEEIQVEVELDPDDPLEGDDDGDDSEYDENELHIESFDPLA